MTSTPSVFYHRSSLICYQFTNLANTHTNPSILRLNYIHTRLAINVPGLPGICVKQKYVLTGDMSNHHKVNFEVHTY